MYSKAGMKPVRLAVTGMHPVAVATLMMSTISEIDKGVWVRLDDKAKVREPSNAETMGIWLPTPVCSP